MASESREWSFCRLSSSNHPPRTVAEQIRRNFHFMKTKYWLASEETIAKLGWINDKTNHRFEDAIFMIQEDMRATQKRLSALEKQWETITNVQK